MADRPSRVHTGYHERSGGLGWPAPTARSSGPSSRRFQPGPMPVHRCSSRDRSAADPHPVHPHHLAERHRCRRIHLGGAAHASRWTPGPHTPSAAHLQQLDPESPVDHHRAKLHPGRRLGCADGLDGSAVAGIGVRAAGPIPPPGTPPARRTPEFLHHATGGTAL